MPEQPHLGRPLGAGAEPGDEVIAVANSDISNTNAAAIWDDAPSIFLFDDIVL